MKFYWNTAKLIIYVWCLWLLVQYNSRIGQLLQRYSGSLQKKFANHCLSKHFNKHFSGIILTVCNLGMGTLLPVPQMRKQFAWYFPLSHMSGLALTSGTFSSIILKIFHTLLYCIYAGDVFVIAKRKHTEKVRTILTGMLMKIVNDESFISKCWLDFLLIMTVFPKIEI